MRLIHLTDPHLTTPPHWRTLFGRSHFGKRFLGYASWARKRRHSMRRPWLDELQAEVASRSPDRLLLTGDLTQIGTPEEIVEALEWLEGLGPAEKISLVPGNHDNYAADAWPNLQAQWGQYLSVQSPVDYPTVFRSSDVAVIGLNSAVPTRPASACGLLGAEQLDRLGSSLDAQADALRILLLHHPPLPGMIKFRKRLRDAACLEAVLAQCPADLILYGHRHRNESLESATTRMFCTAPASAAAGCFRQIDIDRVGDHWQVAQELVQRVAEGRFETVETSRWTVSVPA